MRLKPIFNEHTLDLDRLTPNGWVLDVGARGFEFATEILSYGCRVLSIDASRDVVHPGIEGIVFEQVALADVDGELTFSDWGNGTGSHLVHGRPPTAGGRLYTVQSLTVRALMQRFGIHHFDAVKLDCEGAEYAILATWPGPIATQITGAFHDFIDPAASPTKHTAVLRQLSQWYDVVQHEASVRHGHVPPCHWDSLFTLRDNALGTYRLPPN